MPPPRVHVWEKGSALVEKIKDYYFGKKVEQPVISERTALFCAILFTVIYVAPFYLSKTLRTTPLTSRDAPSVVQARIRAVFFSCIVSTAITIYVLITYGHAETRDILRLFGMWPVDPLDGVKIIALLCVLFIGPLYESVIVDQGWREWNYKSAKETFWDSLPGYRNYVVAPYSEELVFRSLVISLYLLAKVSPTRIIFLTPLIFGVAHIHHFAEFVQARIPPGRTFPSTNVLVMGIVTSLFQFTYTSLFGFFAAFVFLRTGNVFAAIMAHTFCNFMGLPRVWGKVGQFQDWEATNMTPDVAQGKRDDSLDQVRVGNSLMQDQDFNEKSSGEVMRAGAQNLGASWTVVYYGLLVAGAFGFYKLLWRLTESQNALASF